MDYLDEDFSQESMPAGIPLIDEEFDEDLAQASFVNAGTINDYTGVWYAKWK
jgi:hypothetical protein